MKTVEADFFAQLQYPGGLQGGPPGQVAFATKRPNLAKNRYDTALWANNGEKLRRLRPPAGLVGYWWWAQNTLLLATTGGQAEKRLAKKGLPTTVFKTWGTGLGQKPTQLCGMHMEVENAWPLPGGGLLVLARWNPAVEAALRQANNDPQKAAALLEKQQNCTVWQQLPLWENGAGPIAGKRRRLYRWDAKGLHPLTGEKTEVEEVALAPDGTTAYCIAKTYDTVAPVANRLYAIALQTATVRDITFAEMRHDACVPLEDGSLLVAGSDMAAHGLNQNPTFYRCSAGGTATVVEASGRYSVYPSVGSDVNLPGGYRWCAVGRHVYFIATLKDSTHLMQLDTESGAITPVTRQPGMVSEMLPAPNGGFTIIAMRGQRPPEVYSVSADGAETALTRLNDIADTQLAKMQPLTVQSAGRDIHGWVLLPPGTAQGNKPKTKAAETKKIPGLLYIHGGPKTAYGAVLFHEMQYWAAQGYAVLLCNPAGSDGRGDGFADIRGDYGGQDCADLCAFTDGALKRHPRINPRRLGVAGGSYGGFMVNWLIGHTGRFAAAVSQRGIASWASMGLLSDIGYYFVPDQTGTNWPKGAEALAARSPLAHAAKVKTPTLFLHSDEDYRCPLPEGMQMYAALQLAGVPTRLVVFHGENHELSRSGRPQNRVRRLAEMTVWLKKYL